MKSAKRGHPPKNRAVTTIMSNKNDYQANLDR